MTVDDFTVPVLVHLPRHLHRRLRQVADRHGLDVLAPLVVECVRRQLEGDTPAPPPVEPARRPWSPTDEATLRRLHEQGYSDGAIARELGRQQPVVSSWRRKYGLPAIGRFQGGDAKL